MSLRIPIETRPSGPIRLTSAVGRDDVLGPARLDLEEVAAVHDEAQELLHVVGLARRLGEDVEDLLAPAVGRRDRLAHARALLAVAREEREVLPDRQKAGGVV